jgi:hypothetical protein
MQAALSVIICCYNFNPKERRTNKLKFLPMFLGFKERKKGKGAGANDDDDERTNDYNT